jgi:Flp pilus assembly protein TadG
MSIAAMWRATLARVTDFARARRGNVAMIFALSLIPITIAAGAGLDLGRAMVVRARLAEALDAAGLAVGATTGLTQTQEQTLAQQYFNANYTANSSFGTPASVTVTPGTTSVTLSTSVQMPTTLMNVVGINTMTVGYTSQVVWGQTKLWVSLVLDNTGSMTETDSTGTSKISAEKTAATNLIATLESVAANPGDVEVALIPFSKDVNLGTSYVNSSWIDWSLWNAAPANSTPSTSIGPGSACPYSTNKSPYGYSCTTGPSNGASTTSTIPSSGSYSGYICPGVDNGNYNTAQEGRYYNGCYNSVPTQTITTTQKTPTTLTSTATCTSTSSGSCTGSTTTSNSTTTGSTTTTTATTAGYTGDSGPTTTTTTANPVVGSPDITSTGSGSHKVYTTTIVTTTVTTATIVTKTGTGPYNHTWVVNSQSTWDGCVTDRTQNYDISNTAASGSTTNFPAENAQSCPPGLISPLSYDWTALDSAISAMTAQGSTNQPIGLAWGWQAQTQGDPLDATSLPSNTSQVIIILSDGLNTQDRWTGDGSDEDSGTDARMNLICTAAKAAGFTIYAVYVDLNGTQGNSTVLQNCATDTNHYFDLTTATAIVTTFSQIATEITQLRVAQ